MPIYGNYGLFYRRIANLPKNISIFQTIMYKKNKKA